MKNNEMMSVGQGLANPLVVRVQAEADARGHGRATHGAGLGGLVGAMLGSFGGIWWPNIPPGWVLH